jgi:3-hydroxyisobutyrate dehydrogenase-like beta-hydroxyacid dehydrogenase
MMMANDIVVGFIGLGTMGGRMATNILKAGYKVVVHDLHRQSAGHHLQAGAEWADTPRALADKSDVIFTSLPEPTDVERVSLGPDGLIEGVKQGAVYPRQPRCRPRRAGGLPWRHAGAGPIRGLN